jgi:tetratricopeptide (TPR) repeat protein
VVAATGLVVLASAGALWQLRARPYLAVGWFLFLGTLVPVIGLVQIGNQAMADRYMYLPLLGLSILAAWGAFDLLSPAPRARSLLAGLATVALSAAAVLTFRYVPLWVDTLTIFEHALETTRDNPTAQNTVGWHRARRGEYQIALTHFDEAVRIAPAYALAHFNRGTTLFSVGDTQGSIAALERSVELRSGYAPAHFALGVAYETNGQYPEAADAYRAGLQLQPNNLAVLPRLAAVLAAQGHYDDAVHYAERAEQIARDADNIALANDIAAHIARYRGAEALE